MAGEISQGLTAHADAHTRASRRRFVMVATRLLLASGLGAIAARGEAASTRRPSVAKLSNSQGEGGGQTGFAGPLEDRVKIAELNDSYADVITRRDLTSFGSLWAADGSWIHPTAGTSRGRPAIVAMCDAALKNFPMVLYKSSMGSLTVSGRTAKGRAYADELVTDAAGKTYRAFGFYEDEYVKLGQDWLFKARVYHLLHDS